MYLTFPPAQMAVPEGLPEVAAPATNKAMVSKVKVFDNQEPLQFLPDVIDQQVAYDSLPLPKRGPLRLRSGVIARLLTANESLPSGFALTVLDGWRSPSFQRELLNYYRSLHRDLTSGYVADPDDSHVVAPHTTGGAVDLTLNWHGTALALGTDYDSFAEAAHPAYFEGPDSTDTVARDLRRLLSDTMIRAGFAPYPMEWWHWSYGDQWWAATLGKTTSRYGQVAG